MRKRVLCFLCKLRFTGTCKISCLKLHQEAGQRQSVASYYIRTESERAIIQQKKLSLRRNLPISLVMLHFMCVLFSRHGLKTCSVTKLQSVCVVCDPPVIIGHVLWTAQWLQDLLSLQESESYSLNSTWNSCCVKAAKSAADEKNLCFQTQA